MTALMDELVNKLPPADESVQVVQLGKPFSRLSPLAFGREEELLDQLGRLPTPDQVREVMSALPTKTLRELGEEIMNGGVTVLTGGDNLDFARLLNSWFATGEETIAAHGRPGRVLTRRLRA